ncbi:hypothetical protein OG921_04865 [Aldersonia sp. NBC_00410]|uniref:hypothetical protein n=1 Tax=Aldersonia sp. NBC_00410 TaxID=2975954 RepID=UPI00225B9AD6|nr:hypothetical protein [Aldersonia sp. NBC_00410]MCX5042503.1 hypothetical protein [Aldersonia sp. NBC_00410]
MIVLADTATQLVAVKQLPPEVLDPLKQVVGWLLWLVCAGMLAGLIWAGGRLAYQRQHAPHESAAATSIVMILIASVIASSAAGIAAALLTF